MNDVDLIGTLKRRRLTNEIGEAIEAAVQNAPDVQDDEESADDVRDYWWGLFRRYADLRNSRALAELRLDRSQQHLDLDRKMLRVMALAAVAHWVILLVTFNSASAVSALLFSAASWYLLWSVRWWQREVDSASADLEEAGAGAGAGAAAEDSK